MNIWPGNNELVLAKPVDSDLNPDIKVIHAVAYYIKLLCHLVYVEILKCRLWYLFGEYSSKSESLRLLGSSL